jgi:DNA-binding LacI/PurR family transcriptional regulator
LEGGILDAHPLKLWVSLENLAGLIFFSVRALPSAWVVEAAEAKLPLVCAGSPEHAVYDTICTDNVRGMELLTEELLRRGHRRIGFVTSTDLEDHDPCFHLRRIGFEQAMHRAGAKPTHIAAPHNYYVGPQEEKLICDWMDREKPTCLIGACDSIAVQMLTVLERRRLRVPHDISLAGFDSTREFDGVLTRFGLKALTTVAQPWQEIGRLAALRLLARRRGEDAPPTLTLIPPAVQSGDSVRDLT